MNDKKNSVSDAKIRKAFADGQWNDLARLTKQALRKNSRNQLAHRLLGFSLSKILKIQEAENCYKKSIAMFPKDSELLANFANFYIENARNDAAFPLLEKLVILNPESSVIWQKMAQGCYALGLNKKGFDAAENALKYAGNTLEKASALIQRSIHRRELGEIKAAVQDCNEVIKIAPHDMASYNNRMLFLLADPDAEMSQLKAAADEYGEAFETSEFNLAEKFELVDKSPIRKIKIGFISPDFRDHPVMYFVEGVLAKLDRRQFEVYAFHLYPKHDAITERVKYHVDEFHSMHSMSYPSQAEKIKALGIDILIEMAGHTGYNGLAIMLQKPAPVQLTWLGFPATTGLKSIDYRLSDDVTDPDGADVHYTEKVYRLPTLFCCYRPLVREPLWRYQPDYQVKASPALKNGFITFGSCNNLGKLTDDVLTLWGRLLNEVPYSRLLIEGKNLGEASVRTEYKARCQRLGIDVDRLILEPLSRNNQYLTYHKIDIALDPFPLTGGTTTFDLLWMGVPLVSMVGDSFKSRMGTGILLFLGKEAWLANNESEYLNIAKNLASNIEELNRARLKLRGEIEQSVLMNEEIFVHHFGEGLRAMWLEWVAKQQSADVDEQLSLMQKWMGEMPQEWLEPSPKTVGWAPGVRIALSEAHQELLNALDKAKEKNSPEFAMKITSEWWREVVEISEKILCTYPGDAVALSCLAEVEHAHGHTEFAVTYLQYASKAMNLN